MMIINLTQHPATPDQIAAGVIDLTGAERYALIDALTFDTPPSAPEIARRAEMIATIAIYNGIGGDDDDVVFNFAMIGGAPYLMSALESTLLDHGIAPVYAFSKRVSVESIDTDGAVTKVNKFIHAGFVYP